MDGGENSAEIAVRVVSGIEQVRPEDWDACAGADNPFLTHAFLRILEESGSVQARTGWLPQHLVVEAPGGRVLGAMPLYLKSHSQGEYVFDHGWAHAYEQAGGRYYPKLQSAVPFTPVTGRRFLVRPDLGPDDPSAEAVFDTLTAALVELTHRHESSSAHVTFLTEAEYDRLGAHGLLRRTDQQFHWRNDGYETFDDFLAALSSRKRKTIRKERQAVAESDITLRVLTGDAIEARHWDAFYRFYLDTSDRKWGSAYLNRDFFLLLGERMADRVALVIGEAPDGTPVCGALNLIGADRLYGRNWGCLGDYRFLHFEACYYKAIDFAIERGLNVVEAGAQGRHKIQRGYLPVTTHSIHYIRDPGLRRAIDDYLERERRAMDAERDALTTFSPFRKGGDSPGAEGRELE